LATSLVNDFLAGEAFAGRCDGLQTVTVAPIAFKIDAYLTGRAVSGLVSRELGY
jgi:hypothetical protein